MQNIRLNVINEVGLHARPAAEFVKTAAQFNGIEISAEGEDEMQAIQTLRELIESDFAGKF